MTFSNRYSYRERNIFDVLTLLQSLRFLIVNFILALIFLFLTFEEIDWAFYSFRHNSTDSIIDKTPWNIKEIFLFY